MPVRVKRGPLKPLSVEMVVQWGDAGSGEAGHMDILATILGNAYEHARKAAVCIAINDRAAALAAIRDTTTDIEAAAARVQRIRGDARGRTTRNEDD